MVCAGAKTIVRIVHTIVVVLLATSVSAVRIPVGTPEDMAASAAGQTSGPDTFGPTGTPALCWRIAIGEGSVAAPAVDGELGFTTSVDGQIRAFNHIDGTQAWQAEGHGSFSTGPTVVDGTVFAIDD